MSNIKYKCLIIRDKLFDIVMFYIGVFGILLFGPAKSSGIFFEAFLMFFSENPGQKAAGDRKDSS